jgi:hypothetical protein
MLLEVDDTIVDECRLYGNWPETAFEETTTPATMVRKLLPSGQSAKNCLRHDVHWLDSKQRASLLVGQQIQQSVWTLLHLTDSLLELS